MLFDAIDKRTANVYGVYGNLGGGKTLTAVELMISSLSFGWDVISNVRLFVDRLPKSCRRGKYTYLDDFNGVDWWSLPTGAPRGSNDPFRVVIVIDECAEFFDQYSSTSPVLKSFLSWLRHSSKRGQYVFAIVQKPEFLAKSLRLLINKWIVCNDMYQMRVPWLRIRPPFCGDYVMRRVFDKLGNSISRGFNLASKSFIGQFYDTAQSIATEGRNTTYVAKGYTVELPSVMWLFVIAYVVSLFWWV